MADMKYYDAGPEFAAALELLRPAILDMIKKGQQGTAKGVMTQALTVTVGGVDVQLQLRIVRDPEMFVERGVIFVIHDAKG